MKYIVRYEVEGFVTKETFTTKREAKKYYDKIQLNLGNYLLDLEMYEG